MPVLYVMTLPGTGAVFIPDHTMRYAAKGTWYPVMSQQGPTRGTRRLTENAAPLPALVQSNTPCIDEQVQMAESFCHTNDDI